MLFQAVTNVKLNFRALQLFYLNTWSWLNCNFSLHGKKHGENVKYKKVAQKIQVTQIHPKVSYGLKMATFGGLFYLGTKSPKMLNFGP